MPTAGRAPAPAPADPWDPAAFYDELVASGLIVPTGLAGGWGRGAVFEDIVARFDAYVMRAAEGDGAVSLSFPPIVARELIERTGYMDNFPQLGGSIHSFFGSDRDAHTLSAHIHSGERWEHLLEITDAMLTPAVCYPVYPLFSGLLPDGGRLVTVAGWAYRHEPSAEPTRLQAFRMREFIRVGEVDAVLAWRAGWLDRGMALLEALALPVASDIATDPFFGRGGRIRAESQREQQMKFEIVVPVISAEKPTAICSFNWHRDHFTAVYGIRNPDGAIASTACLGFGLERVTLALVKTHGVDPARWPKGVRSLLWP